MTNDQSTYNDGNLFVLLEVLARYRTFILGIVGLTAVVSVIVAFLLPKWYEAETLLLPVATDTMPIGKYGELSRMTSFTTGLELAPLVTPADVHARILTSNVIRDRIIDQFNLFERYDVDKWADVYEELAGKTDVTVTEEGLLTVAVEDRSPDTAALMANAFVLELNRVARSIVSGKARETREFIEERVREITAALDSSRAELESFQLENRTVDFSEQTKLAIDQAITAKTSLAELDLEIAQDRRVYGPDHPELQTKMERRRILLEQLDRLEHGSDDTSFFALPLASVPTLRGQFEFLASRVEVNRGLHEILLEQLEQAKIAENEQSPTVSVIDPATPPDQRSRPKRAILVSVATGLAAVVSILIALFLGYVDRMRASGSADYVRLQTFLGAFFGWVPGLRSGGRGEV